jgi:hypothetical protein
MSELPDGSADQFCFLALSQPQLVDLVMQVPSPSESISAFLGNVIGARSCGSFATLIPCADWFK